MTIITLMLNKEHPMTNQIQETRLNEVNTTFMWKNILQPALDAPGRVFTWVGVPTLRQR